MQKWALTNPIGSHDVDRMAGEAQSAGGAMWEQRADCREQREKQAVGEDGGGE